MNDPHTHVRHNQEDARRARLQRWAEERARLLYDGTEVRHRSCGIALAETFGRQTAPYQALRRGGLTGLGQCGAIKAGELILGELLGDPDPTGPVTPQLRAAILRYSELWGQRLDLGGSKSIVCNDLTSPHGDFTGPRRHAFCTRLAEGVAGCIAQALLEAGIDVPELPPPSDLRAGTEQT